VKLAHPDGCLHTPSCQRPWLGHPPTRFPLLPTQFFMDRAALLAGHPGIYENVTPSSPGGAVPPSPTEQVPISFTEHPAFGGGRANTGPCFYLPYNSQQLKDSPTLAGYARPMVMVPDPRRTATGSRSHVYDEIIVPQQQDQPEAPPRLERPPVPPRPSRTPSRSPPAIPTPISEEGG